MLDVISMQASKKVQDILNKRYSGMFKCIIAQEGQDEFDIGEPCDTIGNSLVVLLNGENAFKETDFKFLNSERIKFNFKTNKGDMVIFKKSYAGVPEYTNPIYDDTKLQEDVKKLSIDLTALTNTLKDIKPYDDKETKLSIESINKNIENIITAIDDDKDGDILDTIGNIKSQWQNADGDIKKLVGLKLDKTDLENEIWALKSVNEIKINVDNIANDIKNLNVSLKEAIVKYDAHFINLDKSIETLNKNTSDNTESITALKESIAKTDNEVALSKNSIKDLSEANTKSSESITSVSNRVTAIENKDSFVIKAELIDGKLQPIFEKGNSKFKIKIVDGITTLEEIKVVPPTPENPPKVEDKPKDEIKPTEPIKEGGVEQ